MDAALRARRRRAVAPGVRPDPGRPWQVFNSDVVTTMDPAFWAKAHGAATHFPIALVLGSAAFDLAGFAFAGRRFVRDLHAAGYWTMLLGALGSAGAVVSGLMMTKGNLWGHGLLRLHHLYVWPAFGLLTGLAAWRVTVGRKATRPVFEAYLVFVAVAAGLVSVAGYWGGELMMAPAQ